MDLANLLTSGMKVNERTKKLRTIKSEKVAVITNKTFFFERTASSID